MKLTDYIDHRVNGLWLFVLGVGLVAAALLTYVYLLEGVMGTFSIQQANPTKLVQTSADERPRVALLNSQYTRDAYAINNPQDTTAAWVNRALNSWNDLLLGQDFAGYVQIDDDQLERGDLAGYDLLILPSALALSDRQIEMIKEFMERGGSIWASWQPGIYDEKGAWRGWTFAEDVFDVTYIGEVGRSNSNFQAYTDTFPGYTPPGMYFPERITSSGVRVTDEAADDSLSEAAFDSNLPTSLRQDKRREAQVAGFTPLRDYVWMDTSTTRLPRADFAIADTMRTSIRGLDGETRVRDAVAVTYYTWNGLVSETPRVPYPNTSSGIRRMTLRAGTPVTGNISSGYRAKVQVFTPAVALETSGDRARPFAFWYDFATEDLNVTEALRTSTAAVYGTYGRNNGRFVYMGFQRNALWIDRNDVEDQETFAQLFSNLLRYLLREPVTWTHDWPAPYDAAAMIAVVDDAGQSEGLESVAALLSRDGYGGTYFVRPDSRNLSDAVLRQLHAQGDVGVYGDFRQNEDGSTLAQTRTLEQMRLQLEQRVGGRVGGYRPSAAGIVDTTTLRALSLSGYNYFLPDSIGRKMSPKIMGVPNERLVRIGYTSRSDRDIDVRSLSASSLLQDVTRAAYEGSLYRMILHTSGLATPEGGPVLSQVIRSLKDQNFWIAPGDELAHWWRLRQNVEVQTSQSGPNRVNVEITNLNAEAVENLAISLVPGFSVIDASSVTVRSEIIELAEEVGLRERTAVRAIVSSDGSMITLLLDRMRPQQTAVLQVNLCVEEEDCIARIALADSGNN